MHRIGLISDTHGLLRPEALAALQGCEHLIHGGDIGKPEILAQLATLAPLTVVRGNNDTAAWASDLPEQAGVQIGGVEILVLHDLADLDRAALPASVRVVVSGHSHKPLVQERDGVLYVNPGSAGPRRFKLPISVGILEVGAGVARASIQELVLS